MNELVKETQDSYYEYVVKIENGCIEIADLLRTGSNKQAFDHIINLTEGFGWLVNAETHMLEQNLKINSRTNEAIEMLNDINDVLEAQDFVTVADLFEYEVAPLFTSASEWVFVEIQN